MALRLPFPSPWLSPSTIQDLDLLLYIVDGKAVQCYCLTLYFGVVLYYYLNGPNLLDFSLDAIIVGGLKMARFYD